MGFGMSRCARGKRDYEINCMLGSITGDNPKNILVLAKGQQEEMLGNQQLFTGYILIQ